MKLIVRILIFGLIALGVSAGLWYYLNGYLVRSKASEATARFAFSDETKKAKGGDIVQVGLTVTADSGITAVDVAFNTEGTNLNFLFPQSTSQLPTGFEAQLLDEATMTSPTSYGTKSLKRMIFVSKKSNDKNAELPKSILIPLHFAVVSSGSTASKSTLSVNFSASQVSGPTAPGNLFTLTGDRTPLTFTVEIEDPRAASVTSLECDSARNLSPSNCGRGVAFVWKDVANEQGYKVYKNNVLIKTLGKDATSYNDGWCANFNANTYSVIAYNTLGSISTSLPTVSCACQICPTPMPPTPTPVLPTNSADLIFRVVFPDAAPQVNEVPNVKVTILDNNGKRICDGDSDCAKVITFQRVPGARIANTFVSPQLQYPLKKNQAYTVVIKHPHTVSQAYKHVYLKWQKVLQCVEGTQDSGCGELIEVVSKRPLFSGDVDGNNLVDQVDADIITVGVGVNSAEGDLNFDGTTDQKDVEILGKNFSKKGN